MTSNNKSLAEKLLTGLTGNPMDSVKACQMISEFYDVQFDYHFISEVLDWMSNVELAKFYGHNRDGYCLYIVK